ncbi:MAG: hypothetical protein B6D61_12845 [Bacteroidetes bacterium 4484_249]|nr:MAG: hypothetical protein B6D61_12845 [Bacteroidetes bacterium 4484_249]
MTDRLFGIFQYGFIFIVLIFVLFGSCRKEDEISSEPSYKLEFSTDTIIFDTVFTTVGSTTRFLKIYNRNDKKVNISNIFLAEGTNSYYKVNIDGTPAVSLKDIELAAHDSLFIFIKVTIDPNQINSPLIVSDSLVFETNGNIQDVDLVAWGQDAHFFVGNKHIQGLSYPYIIVAEENETVDWIDDKPYVIYGWAVIDSTGILNIGPGVDIHFHQNSGLWVYRGGSIHVNGELDSVVTFQGDRLEYEYRDLPGQWDRIWINESSTNNEFNYAVIKNGFIGLQAETTIEDMGNTLILNNTIIKNMSRWGLFTIAYRVVSTNSVYANCAENTLFLSVGGSYDFRHCTFADYWNHSVRLDPSVIISNHLIVYDAEGNQIKLLGNLERAYFGNSIIYGNIEEEIILAKDEQVSFNYQFDNCILKTQTDISDPAFYINCKANDDPLFVDYYENDYRLDTLSPAIDIGSLEIINSSPIDISLDIGVET